MELYTKERKRLDVQITIWDVIEVINYDEDFVDKMIEKDSSDYRYGLSFNEFLFLCLSINDPKILREYTDLFYMFYDKYSPKLEYIEYTSIVAERSLRYEFPEFEINPRLLELLNENINPDYTLEEKILYYYFKLCFLLSVDTKYNFACILYDELGAYNFLKSSNRLSRINDINNEAACFEFTAIFDSLIKMNGGLTSGWPFTGDRQHINSEAVINRQLYRFDALEDPHGRSHALRDMLNVKLDRGYDGIVVGGEDLLNGVNTHLPYIDKIYDDVQKEFSFFLHQKKFSADVIKECFDNIDQLDLDENIKQLLKVYFNKFNSVPLKGVEYYIEIISSFKSEIEMLTYNTINITGVGYTGEGYDFRLILSVKNKNGEYIYFSFGQDSIDILNKAKMIELLESNEIIITRTRKMIKDENGRFDYKFNYRTIPGIDENFQIQCNKLSEKTVLMPMLKEVYDDSLCKEEKPLVLLKQENE